jgi:hypothetical protein
MDILWYHNWVVIIMIIRHKSVTYVFILCHILWIDLLLQLDLTELHFGRKHEHFLKNILFFDVLEILASRSNSETVFTFGLAFLLNKHVKPMSYGIRFLLILRILLQLFLQQMYSLIRVRGWIFLVGLLVK